MTNELITFILSMKWIWIIVIPLAYGIMKKILLARARQLEIDYIVATKDIEYKEGEILEHLHYIIDEALQNYLLFNISTKDIHYINTKMETEIIDYLKDEVPKRLSTVLLNKLSYVYDDDYIGEFIGQEIYILATNYILEFNINSKK